MLNVLVLPFTRNLIARYEVSWIIIHEFVNIRNSLELKEYIGPISRKYGDSNFIQAVSQKLIDVALGCMVPR